MRFKVRMIVTAAVAVLMLPIPALCAEKALPTSGVSDSAATDGSVSSAAAAAYYAKGGAMPEGSGGRSHSVPRFELFLGYSYLRAVPTLAEGNRFVWLNGGSTSLAININRYVGIVGDFGGFADSQLHLNPLGPVVSSSGKAFTYMGGPRISFRHGRVVPFVQFLAGGVDASAVTLSSGCTGTGCTPLPEEKKLALAGGGGIDVRASHHIAIRVIQAEYFMTRFKDLDTGNRSSQNDVRLSTGVVFRFGGHASVPPPPPTPVTYGCAVEPSSVYPGDAITVSGTTANFGAGRTAVYTWTADGGVITGDTATARIDTSNAAPGTYTVKGHASEGDKADESADCSATYVVKAYEPPTVSCTASPSSLNPGESATITAVGASPQNRSMTYSFFASAGTINGTGATATLSTTGAPTGAITVTCKVMDDKNQSGSGSTEVSLSTPPPPPAPTTSSLCSISFGRDAKRPARVDNEAKACLDEIALNMQQNTDSKVALVGHAEGHERDGAKLSAGRAHNTKAYLVTEKGIDAARITVYAGSQDGQTVTATSIPAGATFDTTGNTPLQ